MLILIVILLSLLTPLLVWGLRYSRLRPGYLWILTLFSSFLAWGLVLAIRGQLPLSVSLADWQPDLLFQSSPFLLLDETSWPFAVAVMTLPLAVLLTDVSGVRELDPQTWASSQALAGVGLVAVVAGNPLTLLMTWAVLDIAESVVLLLQVKGSQERERVVVAFSVRVGGMFMLLSAMLRASALGEMLTFQNIPAEVSGYILLAAGLRLGVLPPHQPFLQEPLMRRGLGTLLRFVPVAASVVLLVRAASAEVTGIWSTVFLLLAAFTTFSSALVWLRAKDELQGRQYWVLSLGAFALASAVKGLPAASAAWGLAMLFSGALLFLFSTRLRRLLIIPILGMIGFSALPFTPTWEGSAFFFALPWGYRIVFWAALAILLLGYLRHARRAEPPEPGFERWMWIVYPLGLGVLLFAHFGLTYINWGRGMREISLQTPGWWSGLIPLGLAALFLVWSHREPWSVPVFLSRIGEAFTLNWMYRFFWWLYRSIGRVLSIFTKLLEGDGGILWALLILLMLIVTVNLWGAGDTLEF
jgi:hypothetical protein